MNWFYDLKTATKLATCFGLLLAMLMGVAWTGISSARAMKANQVATFQIDLKTLETAEQAARSRQQMARAYRDAIVFTEHEKMAAAMRDFDRNDKKFHEQLDELEHLSPDETSRTLISDLRGLYAAWFPLAHEAVDSSPVGDSAGDPPRMFRALEKSMSIGGQMDGKTNALIDLAKQRAQARADLSEEQYSQNLTRSVVTVILVFFVVIGSTLLISRAVASPLREVQAVLDGVAQGKLTGRVTYRSKDEIGQLATALNASLDSIATTLASIQAISDDVSAAAEQLAGSAMQISNGPQEQAASLEETAASLEEISSTVKQNTDSAQEASRLANGARDAAERGGQVVTRTAVAMSDITTSSTKIADIVNTIDEIAFQTNLLALNAAVEAARAGEQGRGFGVVAAEVRSLAQRTGVAAKEIRGLIADSSHKVEVGTHQVGESGTTLEEIVQSVKRVTEMVSHIAVASREQNTGLDQVNTAVAQVDRVTQGNAAQTEELSATATELSGKSTQLQSLVAAFDLGNGRARTAARPTASTREASPSRVRSVTPTSVTRVKEAQPAYRKAAGGFEEF